MTRAKGSNEHTIKVKYVSVVLYIKLIFHLRVEKKKNVYLYFLIYHNLWVLCIYACVRFDLV